MQSPTEIFCEYYSSVRAPVSDANSFFSMQQPPAFGGDVTTYMETEVWL